MINLAAVERDHLLTAIEQFDAAGGQELLAEQAAATSGVVVHHGGRTYDGAIIIGVAHGLATGYTPDLDQLRSRKVHIAKAVERSGFEVFSPTQAKAGKRTGHRRPAEDKSSVPAGSSVRVDRAPAICPTCFMALPATGQCDTCGPNQRSVTSVP